MRYFPVFFDLNGRSCLVVGGSEAAARKVRLLRQAGAHVTVVAPRLGAELDDLARRGEVTAARRRFAAADVEGRVLVIAATGAAPLDEAVANAARAAGVPLNVVDRPALSSFTVPAMVDRDPVVVAISSGGAAPVLARRLRARIEALLPARLGRLARFAARYRGAVAATRAEPAARRRFWEALFDGPVADDVLAGHEGAAHERMLALVNRPAVDEAGSVSIVGAGPGDPDLLTVRAVRLLQDADVIVYDRLIGPEILDRARRDAERIYVGKAPGRHARSQDEINGLLVARARAGQRVVRLKGGDPFVFGRGGEEQEFLARHGVPVEVVPGITAATGCAAAAGIALTHRDHASAVTLVAGHGRAGAPEPDWAALAGARQTLVVYMGVGRAGHIAARLMVHGLAPDTPVAVIENGTRPDQRLARGTIAGLDALIQGQEIEGPALIVIGEVARAAAAERDLAPQRRLAS